MAALACLTIAACAPQTAVPPPDVLNLLRAGRPLLTCREACLAEWRRFQPEAAQLDAAARWPELAQLLARVGYQDDLSLYYLGRAAEGIGARAAAITYYRESVQLSGTAIACQNLSRVCGAVVLPRAASVRAAALERELARLRYRRTEPPPAGEAPGAPPEEIAEPAAMSAPAPIPAPAPMPGPPRPPASEFIEPPPAPR